MLFSYGNTCFHIKLSGFEKNEKTEDHFLTLPKLIDFQYINVLRERAPGKSEEPIRISDQIPFPASAVKTLEVISCHN